MAPTNVDIDITSNSKVIDMCEEYSIDIVVIGPEKQFEQGLTNALKEKNVLVFGPSRFGHFIGCFYCHFCVL